MGDEGGEWLGGGPSARMGRKVVNVIEDPDSAQHTQRSTFPGAGHWHQGLKRLGQSKGKQP